MPPIFYMNQTSKLIVQTVHDLNKKHSTNIAAYSIDAGFHVFVFCLKNHHSEVLMALN